MVSSQSLSLKKTHQIAAAPTIPTAGTEVGRVVFLSEWSLGYAGHGVNSVVQMTRVKTEI